MPGMSLGRPATTAMGQREAWKASLDHPGQQSLMYLGSAKLVCYPSDEVMKKDLCTKDWQAPRQLHTHIRKQQRRLDTQKGTAPSYNRTFHEKVRRTLTSISRHQKYHSRKGSLRHCFPRWSLLKHAQFESTIQMHLPEPSSYGRSVRNGDLVSSRPSIVQLDHDRVGHSKNRSQNKIFQLRPHSSAEPLPYRRCRAALRSRAAHLADPF